MREAERTVNKLTARKTKLELRLAEAGTDHKALTELGSELAEVTAELEQAEDGIRDCLLSRGLGDVYKRQLVDTSASSWVRT